MREIPVDTIRETVARLCIEANYFLGNDVKQKLAEAKAGEAFPLAKDILELIEQNAQVAEKERMPLCQDTGMTVVFLEVGQEVHLYGGWLEEAVNQGVRDGYQEGYLRKSVVADPLQRINTGDNTPAVVHYSIVPGERVRIVVAPKGFGSENMSKLKMLKPGDGEQGVKDFVLQVVKEAGPNPCPPLIVGVGLGGTFEKAAFLAKKALLKPLNQHHENPYYSQLEQELLASINKLGIGPQGFGGRTTALAVKIETYSTHIAGLPVAVNLNCHVARHKEAVI